jgi:uncharacterized membrane protein/1-acyl-sn-glycerol-3-phosphate acyltransferase
MRIVKFLFACHLAALAAGLLGLLLIVPFPGVWRANPVGEPLLAFLINSAVSLTILFGAATLFLFGAISIGTRKTLIFFAASTLITLSMELFGTSLGFPFGVSTATTLPGIEVAGLVPYSILLSWFYMGFASFLLAYKLVDRLRLHRQTLWSLLLGAYFLLAWHLALNSALASRQGASRFLLWQEYGSYYGMPMRNLLGWALNGLIFLGLSRLLWRASLDSRATRRLATWLPFGIYTANTGAALTLNLGTGLWFPPLLAVVFVLFPESLALVPAEETAGLQVNRARLVFSQSLWLFMRVASRFILSRKVTIRVEGIERLPASGPTLIAAQHFHWLYDGYVLVRLIPRRMHTIVALDWVRSRWLRYLIELACSLVDWPIVLRSEQFHEHGEDEQWAYTPVEARRYLRQVMLGSVRLLRTGELLLIFPEGYPNIDPHPTPKTDLETILPFRSGFVKLVELAEKDRRTRVAIIPVGFHYIQEAGNHWLITARFGQPLYRGDFDSAERLLQTVEQDVLTLSHAEPPSPAIGEI